MDDVIRFRSVHQKVHTPSKIVKHSVVIRGHKTSIALEKEFWVALKEEIAINEGVTITYLVTTIDAQRTHGNLSSAIRLFVLDYYKQQVVMKRKAA